MRDTVFVLRNGKLDMVVETQHLRSEMSTDQDWFGLVQDWTHFWPDQDLIALQFFFNWRIRTGSD